MRKRTALFRNNKGFTLAEMLIAVAVLSLLGLSAIQVFITANSLNHKAADMDRAVAVSTELAERLKSLPADSLLDSQTIGGLFPDALVSIGADGKEGSVNLLYTQDWQTMSMASSQLAGFVVDARLKAASPEEGGITLLTVRVVRQGRYFHKADPQPLLFEMEAALSQPLKGGAN